MRIRLENLPVVSQKINCIRCVRYVFGMGLKDAKDFVENAVVYGDRASLEGGTNRSSDEVLEDIKTYNMGARLVILDMNSLAEEVTSYQKQLAECHEELCAQRDTIIELRNKIEEHEKTHMINSTITLTDTVVTIIGAKSVNVHALAS